jgi:phosphohistidine phosphatase
MELVIVRHAIAEEREEFARTGKDDAERPLTRAGRRKFEQGAPGLLRTAGDLDLLATSTLVRAIQTAELVEAAHGGKLRTARLAELAPEADPAGLLAWARRKRRLARVAVVGHEPHLSAFVALAVGAARGGDAFELKKGGACLLDLGKAPRAGRATLRWLLTADQLRRLGR